MKADAGRRSRADGYPVAMPSTAATLAARRPFRITVRRAIVLLLLCTWAATPAWGQSGVAELGVTSYGRQRLDLASGRTVLEDGGELADRGSGVRLSAAWISYEDGVDVVARDVVMEGDLGRVTAPDVVVDLASGRVTATGGIAWTRAGLAIRGVELRFDAAEGIAWLIGDVVASVPEVEAAEVWVEVVGGRVLLLGPYRYAEGFLVLTGGDGSALQLDAVTTSTGSTYDARTDVEPGWRETVERLRADGGAASDD